MKIYTKTGDKGKTSLFDGTRVAKHHEQIEAYGTVDELNTFIANLIVALDDSSVTDLLFLVQKELFSVGAYLAGAYQKQDDISGLSDDAITRLEAAMDAYNEQLPQLKSFVIPGGNEASARAHLCRTVCRRAERRVVLLNKDGELNELVIQYLNRLSDYFFVLSRKLIYDANGQEVLWTS